MFLMRVPCVTCFGLILRRIKKVSILLLVQLGISLDLMLQSNFYIRIIWQWLQGPISWSWQDTKRITSLKLWQFFQLPTIVIDVVIKLPLWKLMISLTRLILSLNRPKTLLNHQCHLEYQNISFNNLSVIMI